MQVLSLTQRENQRKRCEDTFYTRALNSQFKIFLQNNYKSVAGDEVFKVGA